MADGKEERKKKKKKNKMNISAVGFLDRTKLQANFEASFALHK